MLPLRHRGGFYRIAEHVGFTLRRLLFGRLMAMLFEGVFTWFMLTLGHVPMAGLLGLVTGVLAFIPNIGAITSGLLMIAVGFSASANQGLWCIVVYFLVHNIDAYVVMPYVARRTVDLAPAVVLAFQLLMAALFGILGVLFADPILATLKVVLVDISKQQAVEEGEDADLVDPRRATVGAPAPAALEPAAAPSAASAAPASAASSRRRRGRSSGPAPRS
jgi:predicted PurR-regulated permease PerM